VSERDPAADGPFSARAVMAGVVVGVVALCAMLVLMAYAPEIRGDDSGGASALSKSAIGFAGLERAMRTLGAATEVSRTGPPPRAGIDDRLIVITPSSRAEPAQTRPFARGARLIVILPKWSVAPAPNHPGFVTKVAPFGDAQMADRMLNPFAVGNRIDRRAGVTRPKVRLVQDDGGFGAPVTLDPIDRLQTLSGGGWDPVLVDENGRMLAGVSRTLRNVLVVADPDLLNNQGLSKPAIARVGLDLVERARGKRPLVLDVTLNGLRRGDSSLLRLALEPPWLAATLCGLAAAVMIFLHALGRFGRPADETPAFGAGRRALVENTAAMVRTARKEPQMAPLYARLIFRQVGDAGGRAEGPERDQWLETLARLRGLDSPARLSAQAASVTTRDELMVIIEKLHEWKRGALSGGR
jgi:hypothetical protein